MRSVSKRLRIRWAKRLIGAKYFVAMTDTQSVVALDAADPNEFTDVIALAAQAAELEAFYDKLGMLIQTHKDILKAYAKEQDAKATTTHRTTTKPKSGHVPASVRSRANATKAAAK